MDNQFIEKLLCEKAAHLPEANFSLTIPEMDQKNIRIVCETQRHVNLIFRTALVALFVILGTLGICFGVSAEFRQAFMTLFRADSPEIVPGISVVPSHDNHDTIQFIGKQSIGSIADISYFNFGGNSVSNNIASVDQANGSTKYYLLQEDSVAEITPIVTRVTDTVHFNGHTLLLDFEYGLLNGESFLRNLIDQNLTNDGDLFPSIPIAFYDEDTVWINASSGNQILYNAYYLLYDLKTGGVSDVLADIVPANTKVESITLSPDKQKLILKTFNGGWPGIYMYFDTMTKKATSISELIGSEQVYDCSFANNNTLYIELYHNELHENMTDDDYILSGYCYSLNNGEKAKLFKEYDSVIYALHGTCILKENNEYKIIVASGETYTVEGIDLGLGYSFLMNPDHTKIAFLNFSSTKAESLGASEIGIIDLTKKEIRTFDREGYNKNDEISISWNDTSSLVVTTSESAFFVYRFK